MWASQFGDGVPGFRKRSSGLRRYTAADECQGRRYAPPLCGVFYDALALTAIDCTAFSYHGEDRNSVRRAGRGDFAFVAFLRGELTVLRLTFFEALWFKLVSLRRKDPVVLCLKSNQAKAGSSRGCGATSERVRHLRRASP